MLLRLLGAVEGAAPATTAATPSPTPENLAAMLQRIEAIEQFINTWEPRLNALLVLVDKL